MADGIPGRGPVAGLIEGFEKIGDQENAERNAVRMLKGHFDMNDFAEQVQLLEKMGPLTEKAEKSLGIASAPPNGADMDHEQLGRIVAMIASMTEDEHRYPERFVVTSWEEIVDGGKGKDQDSIAYDAAVDMSRLRRVAQGSGCKVQEVVGLLHRFAMMRQMMIQIGRSTGLFG